MDERFVLGIAGALITMLLAVAAWLIKDRVQTAKEHEREKESKLERYLEKVDRSLAAGSQRFERQDQKLDDLKREVSDTTIRAVPRSEFDGFCRDQNEQHKRIDQRLEQIIDGQVTQSGELRGLAGQMETVKDLLARKTDVG